MLPYLTALFVLFDGETALVACVLRATTKKIVNFVFRKNVHPGDLAGGFSDLEMTSGSLLRWRRHCLYVIRRRTGSQ